MFECTNGYCDKHIYGIDGRIAIKTATSTFYHHGDHLGSTSVVTDNAGNQKESITYYPFGETRSDNSSVYLNYKFTGQELDSETGLYNYNARLYDPSMGRFLTPDTIVPNPANPQSLNRYSYVDSVGKPPVIETNLYAYTGNNPINNTDPLGLFTVSQVPGMLKTGVGQLMDQLPQMAFGTVLGRLLNGPTSVLGFFASPDTFAFPLQEDMRYRSLFPNMYGYPTNSANRLGLVYDQQTGLFIQRAGSELHNCGGR